MTNSFGPAERVAIVAHDAGGAEILSSYARRNRGNYGFVLEGPARSIFERKLGPVRIDSLEDALRDADSLLCGTSWQSDLEYRALDLSDQMGKRSIAFLDHWVNYRERFQRNGMFRLPDEIWVGDEMAAGRARVEIPEVPVRLVPNPYLEDLEVELGAIGSPGERKDGELKVLYVAEPVRDHALMSYGDERHWGYVEEEALEFFLAHLDALGAPIGEIRLRPHPSEEPAKYDAYIARSGGVLRRGGGKPLVAEVSECDVVVGCESMAMVVGLIAGKRVVSSIPPGGKPCSLPHAGIVHLQSLIPGSRS